MGRADQAVEIELAHRRLSSLGVKKARGGLVGRARVLVHGASSPSELADGSGARWCHTGARTITHAFGMDMETVSLKYHAALQV
ncbi:hypothetical protein ANI02nite_20880 [Acetobacter nitrogenifigens DSM 23921 = NBRC 105050]|uniref:Uncharacterized protein n=1 Tax=Acetobacter nitrogenifigens DSM 23921 = NBRC 105050 TaxID=1120919 RepID=A0A511XB58_9PROT|nr:hypothetical protein ANI02nite_20880 [Acetobacter nitrogenifigens DSM 23921 = NBRC 105050]